MPIAIVHMLETLMLKVSFLKTLLGLMVGIVDSSTKPIITFVLQ